MADGGLATGFYARSGSEGFPGFSSLYSMSDPCLPHAFRAKIELARGEAWQFMKSEITRTTPVRAVWAMGSSRPMDVIWTTLALPMLMSERACEALHNQRFSGWNTVPVDLRGKKGEQLGRYFLLCISGRCGPIDLSRGETLLKRKPHGLFSFRRGLYFDPETWEGWDIFMSEDRGYRFVTERVRASMRNFDNVEFRPLDAVEHSGPHRVGDTLS